MGRDFDYRIRYRLCRNSLFIGNIILNHWIKTGILILDCYRRFVLGCFRAAF